MYFGNFLKDKTMLSDQSNKTLNAIEELNNKIDSYNQEQKDKKHRHSTTNEEDNLDKESHDNKLDSIAFN